MDLLIGYSLALPVLAARELAGPAFLLDGEVAGTCFGLGGEWVLTAGHVASGLPTAPPRCGVVGIHQPGAQFVSAKIIEVEPLAHDLALMRLQFAVPASAEWFHRFLDGARDRSIHLRR